MFLVSGYRSLGWLRYALRAAPTVIFVDLAAAATVSDAVLILGHALKCETPGSAAAVADKLSRTDSAQIVLDARHVPAGLVIALHSNVSLLAPHQIWWAALRDPAPLPNHVSTPEPWPALPTDLAVDIDAAAWLPGSPRIAVNLSADQLQIDTARPCLRPDLAFQLRSQPRRSVGSVADAAIHTHRDLLVYAIGEISGRPDPMALFGLRLIAESATDPNIACLAAAAAARVRLMVGQPIDALARIDQALSRTTLADPVHRAILIWTEAIVQLGIGERALASARFEEAITVVHSQRDLNLLATMHRQWADAITARGLMRQAAEHYRTARGLYRRQGNHEGMSATVRGAADIAVCSGETLSAEALYDQADMSTTTDIEQANRLVGQAGLAIATRAWGTASALFGRLQRMQPTEPLILANIKRREADQAFHSGDLVSATQAAQDAQKLYAQAGATAAGARCKRLETDAAVLQGELKTALRGYRDAAHIQIKTGDWLGLQRTVEHMSHLCEPQTGLSIKKISAELVLLGGTT